MTNRTLVIGGSRSGKSRFAENLAAQHRDCLYIATAEAGDEEMVDRIKRHRQSRAARWQTIEEPLSLLETIAREHRQGRFILVDCLTLWISNLMQRNIDIQMSVDKLVAGLFSVTGELVFVSNEVGMGIVPDNPLARRFRDEAGFANQRIAEACDTVWFLAAGLPMKLKG